MLVVNGVFLLLNLGSLVEIEDLENPFCVLVLHCQDDHIIEEVGPHRELLLVLDHLSGLR